jgi:hypothetical protein
VATLSNRVTPTIQTAQRAMRVNPVTAIREL